MVRKAEGAVIELDCLSCTGTHGYEQHKIKVKPKPGKQTFRCPDGDPYTVLLRKLPHLRLYRLRVIETERCECDCGEIHHDIEKEADSIAVIATDEEEAKTLLNFDYFREQQYSDLKLIAVEAADKEFEHEMLETLPWLLPSADPEAGSLLIDGPNVIVVDESGARSLHAETYNDWFPLMESKKEVWLWEFYHNRRR